MLNLNLVKRKDINCAAMKTTVYDKHMENKKNPIHIGVDRVAMLNVQMSVFTQYQI